MALPALSTIGSSLTPALYQSIATQLRAMPNTGVVTVNGRQYSIGAATSKSILASNPAPSPISQPSGTIGGTTQPETAALAQMAQIDPATEALRQGLAQSYLAPLQQAGAPTADQFLNYQSLYGQIDPTGMAGRQALGQQLVSDVQLGSQLDPETQRQLEQQTRLAQSARGNVYGTPHLVEEAMTTGQAGLQLRAQRQQALQSYLQSGTTPGDVTMNFYNNIMAQHQQQQQAALSYLQSGATPYQAGSQYYQQAQTNAANAAQGGPQYNPQSLSPSMTGTSQQAPQYGLDISAQSQNFMAALNQGNMYSSGYNQKNPLM